MAHLGVDDDIEAQRPPATSLAPGTVLYSFPLSSLTHPAPIPTKGHASGGQTQETDVAPPEPGGHASRTSVNREIDPNSPALTSQVVGGSHEFLCHSVPNQTVCLIHLPAQGEGKDNQGTSFRLLGPNMLRRRRLRHRALAMCKKETQMQSDLGVCISSYLRVSMI